MSPLPGKLKVLANMGVTKGADFDEFVNEDFEGEELTYYEDATERRRPQKAARKNNKTSWRSVEDYLETRRLKRQLSDVFDED